MLGNGRECVEAEPRRCHRARHVLGWCQIEVNASRPPPWAIPHEAQLQSSPPARPDLHLWAACEALGLLDRYESLIASVCYEYIEEHVNGTCAKKWEDSMLGPLREWMAEKVVPWMVMPYARGARNGQ